MSLYLFNGVELWVNRVAVVIMLGLQLWALIDCATRNPQAFPAVNKLTKPVWLAITLGGFAIASLLASLSGFGGPFYNPISLIALIAALVYLADVRPSVREVSGGSGQRW